MVWSSPVSSRSIFRKPYVILLQKVFSKNKSQRFDTIYKNTRSNEFQRGTLGAEEIGNWRTLSMLLGRNQMATSFASKETKTVITLKTM